MLSVINMFRRSNRGVYHPIFTRKGKWKWKISQFYAEAVGGLEQPEIGGGGLVPVAGWQWDQF